MDGVMVLFCGDHQEINLLVQDILVVLIPIASWKQHSDSLWSFNLAH